MDLSRYRKPALHFSGGKDSLACLYLLQDQLDRVTVYWVNTGDGCPETQTIVEQMRAQIPNFVEVKTDVASWRRANGYPSDLTPANSHLLGVAYGMNDFRLSNRFDCCFANLMRPMHERMVADGVDAVIRGTKAADTGTLPAEGKTEFYDILLPLRDWTHEDVFTYLKSVDAPRNPIYDYFTDISAPECMGCTAWWGDGKAKYLRALHPEKYHEHRISLYRIKRAVESHLVDLEMELGS
jgi:3'-phosphoadenosine 5'-phosphosulfate sulfotransferase (PAPS reductase)/FAD synthetase